MLIIEKLPDDIVIEYYDASSKCYHNGQEEFMRWLREGEVIQLIGLSESVTVADGYRLFVSITPNVSVEVEMVGRSLEKDLPKFIFTRENFGRYLSDKGFSNLCKKIG